MTLKKYCLRVQLQKTKRQYSWIPGSVFNNTTPDKNESINLKKSLMFICMQAIKFTPHFVLEILKRYCSKYFDKFEDAWPKPTKMTVSVCRKLRCLSSCKKSTSTFTSSLWLLWTYLSRHTKNYSITLSKTLMFSFIHCFFLTIL